MTLSSPEQIPTTQPTAENPTGHWLLTEAPGNQGPSYSGTVDIQPFEGIYRLSWSGSMGNYSGLAFLEDNHLLGTWGSQIHRLILYKINPDGALNGRWVCPMWPDRINQETAVEGKPGWLEGHYQISGTYPGMEDLYEGELDICMLGNTYQLTWYGDGRNHGVGLKVNDWLVVARDVGSNFGVINYTFEGDTAKGWWALPGNPNAGTAMLTRTAAAPEHN